MASFIDRILSGDYPVIKELFEKDYFGKIADEIFGDPLAKLADPDGEECANDRCRVRMESAMREIAVLKADKSESDYRVNVVKAERDALQKKLDGIRESLGLR